VEHHDDLCYDPEIPVDIYDFGLIYGVTVAPDGAVHISMTLTAPNCPAAQELPAEVARKVRSLPGVTNANVLPSGRYRRRRSASRRRSSPTTPGE